MQLTEELNHFYKIINAVDILDATKNEIMVWITGNGKFEVDFSIVGKSPKARMRVSDDYAANNVKCSITLFDELHQTDGEIILTEGADYTAVAKKLIAYLHNPRDQF